MKYAARYYMGYSNPSIDEIIILWHKDDTKEGLQDFIDTKLNISQRLVIDVSFIEDNFLVENYDKLFAGIIFNIAFKLNFEQKEFVKLLFGRGNQFFYSEHINTWDQLYEVISDGVSDVYITDELGFELREVGIYCHNRGIKVRVFPNIAQSIEKDKNDLHKFFIRPDDEYIYDKYVDIYEFFGPLTKQDVLFRIYNSHKWLGDLSLLILGMHTCIKNNCIAPMWAEARTHCKGNCENCKICINTIALANTLENNHKEITVDYPEKEHDIDYLKNVYDDIKNQN